jgi:uncharacterized protein (TIGR03435 family)
MKTCILFAVLAVGTVFGQEFDVASIRPSAPVGMSYSTNINSGEGTLRTKNTTLFDLILFALKAQPYQVSGGPGWVRDLRFDISAKSLDEEKRPKAVTKAEKDAEDERFRARVRNLLADRFQLKLSEQEKDLPVYAMTVEKTGHKLKPSTAEDGNVNGNRTGDKGSLVATGIETESIAEVLGGIVDKPVIDQTGLEGRFDFELKYTLDLGAGGNADAAGANDSASLFTAVREQLGLRLTGKRGPVRTWGVVRAERPGEN